MHPPQRPVAPALQRRMNVCGDAARLRHQTQQVVGEVHRLYRAEPQPLHIRLRQQPPQQIGQSHPAALFPAPPAQIDAAQHHLSITSRQPAYLLHHLVGGRAPAASAHERDNAERAPIVAAILNLQIGACAIARRVFHRRRQKIALLENIAHMDVSVVRSRRHDLRDLRLVRVAHHPLHTGHRRQFLRSPLRVAARHQDARLGILAMYPPDGLPHVVVRRRSHRTGIEHHQVGARPLTGGR